MTILLFANNAKTTLAAPISSGATTLQLTTGTGSYFPSPGAGQGFMITVADAATHTLFELMLCTARTGDVLTVVRAQEGTTALSWVVGSVLANTMTAGAAQTFSQTGATSYTTTTANFTQPAVSSTVSVSMAATAWLVVGMPLYVATGGNYTVFSITDATHAVLTNTGATGNSSPGATINSASGVASGGVIGPQGTGSYTSLTASFTQPAVSSTVSATVGNTGWMATGQPLFVSGGGAYTVSSITDSTHVVLTNTGTAGNAAPGVTVSSGAVVSPSGATGATGGLTGGTLTGALNWATPVTIASSATVNIGSAASNVVLVSGSVTITAFDTQVAGVEREVTFSGSLTLTHNAASLILPGSVNFLTGANDTLVFRSLGSGNWLCTSFTRASGAVVTPSVNKMAITAPATSSTLAVADGKTFTASNTLTLVGTDGTTQTMPASTDTLVGRASTDTLTNKRITARVGSTTSSATPTINTDNVDVYRLTAQAVAITSMTTNLSGTPTHDQDLLIEITGTGAVAITWGSSFEATTVALPTTTVGTTLLTVGFLWNSATSKWRCMGAA